MAGSQGSYGVSRKSGSQSYWNDCLRLRQKSLLNDAISEQSQGNPLGTDHEISAEAYDEEMAAVRAVLHSLAVRRNAALVASTLKPDVLILIFEACRDDGVAVQRGHETVDTPIPANLPWAHGLTPSQRMGWIVCSQVCQHWRKVALGSPSLWKDIFLGLGPEWVRVSMDRAQTALDIHLFGALGGRTRAHAPHLGLRLDSTNFQHLSAMSINIADHDILATFLRLLSRDRSSLKRIVLNVSSSMHAPVDPAGPACKALSLLIQQSPMVQRISLDNVFMKWEPLPFIARCLVRLEVTAPHDYVFGDDFDPQFDIRSAVKFLANTPLLNNLMLHNTFPVLRDIPGANQITELPQLQDLELATGSSDCFYFLSHVTFPACKTRLHLSGPPIDAWRIPNLIHMACRCLHEGHEGSEGDGVLQLTIYRERLQLLAHPTSYPLFTPYFMSEFFYSKTDVNLSFRVGDDVNWEAIILAARNALPSSFVRTLILEGGAEQLWHNFAEYFPLVTSIVTSNYGFTNLPLEPPPFPKLVSLSLHDIDLTHGSVAQRGVLNYITKRKSMGKPLRRVVLRARRHELQVGELWIEDVRNLVEVVEEEGSEFMFPMNT